jgi:replicative DNA helicase
MTSRQTGEFVDLHRPMPQAVEAEKGILSSMMLDPKDVIPDAAAHLTLEHFIVPAHILIFATLVDEHAKGHALDLITFSQALEDRNLLEQCGGRPYIAEIATFVPTAANSAYYRDIVRDKFLLREIIHRGTQAVRAAYEEQEDPEALLDRVQGSFIEIGELSRFSETMKHIREVIPEVMARIETIYHNRGSPIGLSTGFVDFDRTCGGFQPPRTYYIGARPAMGKSSLGTEFAEAVAIDNAEKRGPVAIFSVEMTTAELAEVVLCRRGHIDLVKLRDGFFSKEQMEKLADQADTLKRSAIYVDDSSPLSILEFRARARRAVRVFGVQLIIIDYIQRMSSTSKRAQNNREQEINEIAQGISATAKELNIPIVVLAQLSRKSEERANKTPELADFRESGSLEQEAHLVGLLHRPSYYTKTLKDARREARKLKIPDVPKDDDKNSDDKTLPWLKEFAEYTQLIVAKQRRGPVGTIRLRFIKKYAHFESEDPDRPMYSTDPEERQQTVDPAESFVASCKEVFGDGVREMEDDGENGQHE